MKNYNLELENRVIEEALYTIENNSTVRNTALKYGISKSTIHSDITKRLYDISMPLYDDVAEVLGINKIERTKRGGMATKHKHNTITGV